VLKQHAVWKAIDTNASADLKNMDNGALEQFVPMAQQFAAQIQNIMGRGPMALGAPPGGFGQTGPGVQQAQQATSTSTNQITKILENFLRQYGLVALDTLFCEQEGEEDIIVDDETKDVINEVTPGTIGDNNKIHMDWQRFYAAIEEWTVEVSVSLSQDQINDKKRADLQDMLVVLAQNAQELGPSAVQKVQEITDMLLQDQVPLAGPLQQSSPLAPAQAVQPPPANPAVSNTP
jgi:hypothetical protein